MGRQIKISRKEKNEQFMSKWAFVILFALCIQFLVYLVILNIVPTFVKDENGVTIINSLYYMEKDYYGSSQYDNGTRIIYYYNMVLLIATIFLLIYYFVNFMEHNDGRMIKKIKQFLKEQWPFSLLLVFMLWVFVSSLLAKDYYRSFVGCFNLKDGYLSFLMYGSMLVCSLLILKNEKYKKIIVNTFLITATIVAVLTLWNYYYLNSDMHHASKYIGKSFINCNAYTIGELLFGNGTFELGENFLIVTKRIIGEPTSGIFHNSNHYGYYLSISVIVAAVMFMKQSLKDKEEKYSVLNICLSIAYLVSYIIMVKMTILNNTLGAYLGIGASIVFMIVYAIIPKLKGNTFEYFKELICTALVVGIFVILSVTTVNANNGNIVYSNFSILAEDFKTLIGNNDSKEVIDNTSNNEIDEVNKEESETKEEEKDVADIGSGRGILWVKAWEMALQRPFFGYGLENIKYEYDEQFGINEGRSHNLILQLSATTGIVGMLLYVVGIAAIWIKKLKYIKAWDIYECLGMFVIVSYIISSIVGNSAFYTSGYFYIFVGFVTLNIPKQEVIVDAKKKK